MNITSEKYFEPRDPKSLCWTRGNPGNIVGGGYPAKHNNKWRISRSPPPPGVQKLVPTFNIFHIYCRDSEYLLPAVLFKHDTLSNTCTQDLLRSVASRPMCVASAPRHRPPQPLRVCLERHCLLYMIIYGVQRSSVAIQSLLGGILEEDPCRRRGDAVELHPELAVDLVDERPLGSHLRVLHLP
eukprot:1190358-Prorocentrum_minimum.AAC.2